MTSGSITSRTATFHRQRRRRTVFFRRLCENVRRHPWALASALLLMLALGWAMVALVEIPLPGGSNTPLLILLWNTSVKLAAMLVAFLLMLAFFSVPPKRALQYEAEFAHIEFTDRYGNPPALISRERIKHSQEEKITFYSAGISLEQWSQWQGKIQDALNITYAEPPQYAFKKRYFILLTVVSGIAGHRKENLYDDEL